MVKLTALSKTRDRTLRLKSLEHRNLKTRKTDGNPLIANHKP